MVKYSYHLHQTLFNIHYRCLSTTTLCQLREWMALEMVLGCHDYLSILRQYPLYIEYSTRH